MPGCRWYGDIFAFDGLGFLVLSSLGKSDICPIFYF